MTTPDMTEEMGPWEKVDHLIDLYFREPYQPGPRCWKCNDTGRLSTNTDRRCGCDTGQYMRALSLTPVLMPRC